MSEATEAAIRALRREGVIARDDVVFWMASPDLNTRAVVYALTERAWARIQPPIPGAVQCSFMASYLVDCIERNPEQGEYLHTGFGAAYEFSAWLKHLLRRNAAEFIRDAASRLEAAFRRGDEETRNRIETGALEHILEAPQLRPFFAHWQTDPVLTESHSCALEWGKAHEEH